MGASDASLTAVRCHVVTGKGGTGRSTVAAALARALHLAGRRVLACEVQGTGELPRLLGASASGVEPTPVRGDERLCTVQVQPDSAMREYGLMVLKLRPLYEAVFENRLVRPLLRAIPQLPEVVMLGKLWWHVDREKESSGALRWDHVVVDAPATGHGLGLLGTPSAVLELLSDGPMLRDLRQMQALLHDPTRTAVHMVTLPEELPTHETLELHAALQRLQLPLGRLIVNTVPESRFTPEELAGLESIPSAELRPVLSAARRHEERVALAHRCLDQLRTLPMARTLLPWVGGDDPTSRLEVLSRLLMERTHA